MERKIPLQFQGEILSSSPTSNNKITKARVSLFYKGENRNFTFLTEDFINNSLLPSLPYTPVVGIYSEEEEDFKSHSLDPNEARIYGIIPENPNVTWEELNDKDGVTRVYAVCDAYLYTKRLKAANKIIGKPQSMELDPDSIDGDWKMINGDYFFEYTKGEFLGVSVLGTKVEPCFEGAKFFELVTQFSNFMQEKYNKEGGQEEEMETVSETLNTTLPNEEDNTENQEQEIVETEVDNTEPTVESEETVVESEEDGAENENQEETQEETVEIETETEASYTLTGEELNVYNSIIESSGSLSQLVADFNELKNNFNENQTKILEFQEENNTLRLEVENQKGLYSTLEEKYNQLFSEWEENFKKEKMKVCQKYSSYISTEDFKDITDNLSKYNNLVDLEKDLLYISRNNLSFNYVSTSYSSTQPKVQEDGVEALLRKIKENKK